MGHGLMGQITRREAVALSLFILPQIYFHKLPYLCYHFHNVVSITNPLDYHHAVETTD